MLPGLGVTAVIWIRELGPKVRKAVEKESDFVARVPGCLEVRPEIPELPLELISVRLPRSTPSVGEWCKRPEALRQRAIFDTRLHVRAPGFEKTTNEVVPCALDSSHKYEPDRGTESRLRQQRFPWPR